MPFFKDLRRRSKASSHTTRSTASRSNESQPNGEMASGRSTSTLDTASYKSVTPPSSIKLNLSSPNLPSLSEFADGANGNPPANPPPRPGAYMNHLNRNSTLVRPIQFLPGYNRLIMFNRGVARPRSMGAFVLPLPRLPILLGSSQSRIIHGYVCVSPCQERC